ncbi:thiamine diphosphokinase [Parapedobacter defluvii]|uniref:thiamine diphosphokinase n=1 Tax=Parapedobacter defluvii TaxID=2045106 RepID=UPI000FA81DBC|nr:MAG: thiamine diphosphokinase [Parapedobacter sp.]
MSSHHIVKEDQEPALIIAATDRIPSSLLNQLLEWNPIVITDGRNLEHVVQLGIKVDVLVTDEPADLSQDHVFVLPLTTSFLDTALTYLIKRGCRAANILSTDVDPNLLLRYAAKIQVVLLSNGRRTFVVKSGFTKWKPKGESVFLHSNQVIETKGLQQTGENEYITAHDGFYSIHFDQSHGLVGEQI